MMIIIVKINELNNKYVKYDFKKVQKYSCKEIILLYNSIQGLKDKRKSYDYK